MSKFNTSNDRQRPVPKRPSPWANNYPQRATYPGAPKQSDRETVESTGAAVERVPGEGMPNGATVSDPRGASGRRGVR